MLSVAITSGRMETFARTLDRVAASGVAPKLRVESLRSSFLATDAQGRSWTLDLESHRWRRLDGERSTDEDPPQQLFIDPELRASLEQLEAMAARAIVKGDSIHMPRNAWFRAADLTPESLEPAAPSVVLSGTPKLPVEREPSPMPITPVAAPVIATRLEPAIHASVEIPPAPATAPAPAPAATPAPTPAATPTPAPALVPVAAVPARKPRVRRSRQLVEPVGEHAPLVAARATVQVVAPVEKATPRRHTIPKEHLRFAGPGFISISDDLETPVLVASARSVPPARRATTSVPSSAPAPRRRDTRERKRWMPTSIAPHLMSEHPEAHEHRVPAVLSGLAAALLFALASWMGDGRGYAAGLVFAFLTITLVVLNHARARDD